MKKFLKGIMPLLALLTLAACSSGSEDDGPSSESIVGLWVYDETADIVSTANSRPVECAFFADGTAVIDTLDLRTGDSGYGYYTYVVTGNVINIMRRIDSHNTYKSQLSGAFSIDRGHLTLNNFEFNRQPLPQSTDFATKIVGSWSGDIPDDDRMLSTVITFRQDGSGMATIMPSNASPYVENFNWWVKENYLIFELDADYRVATFYFGNLGGSVVINRQRFQKL